MNMEVPEEEAPEAGLARDAVMESKDIVSIFFRFMSQTHQARLARVSKSWHVASQSPQFWKHLDFDSKLRSPATVRISPW